MNPNFLRRYFVGRGIDIGGHPDPLCLYQELFPLVESIITWDLDDGDAQFMSGVPNESFDFCHSSHCLEHLKDPQEGLRSWFRIVRPGGYLIVTVPDEDLYEQGVFPISYYKDNKWTFTIFKAKSWSPKSVNVINLIQTLGDQVEIEKIELLTGTFRYNLPRFDQTLTPVGESSIEFVLRKRLVTELREGGPAMSSAQINPELAMHLNQYVDDWATLKAENMKKRPFQKATLKTTV
jgi:SAM-dependent methyltransferase